MLNPWIDLPSEPPYVLAQDAHDVGRFNRRVSQGDFRLQVETVLPEPFNGNPSAQLVLLQLNPGYLPEDVGTWARPDFRSLWLCNLRHEPTEHPFVYLDPRFHRIGGGRYWLTGNPARRGVLRSLVDDVGLQRVARNILLVEWFPYKSHRYKSGCRTPSQQYGFWLVAQAIERGAHVVALRSVRQWLEAVPLLGSYDKFSKTRSNQNPVISPGNLPSYREIVRALVDKE